MENNGQTQTVDPEVLPPMRQSPLSFDMQATLRSPWFWVLVGAAGMAITLHLLNKKRP